MRPISWALGRPAPAQEPPSLEQWPRGSAGAPGGASTPAQVRDPESAETVRDSGEHLRGSGGPHHWVRGSAGPSVRVTEAPILKRSWRRTEEAVWVRGTAGPSVREAQSLKKRRTEGAVREQNVAAPEARRREVLKSRIVVEKWVGYEKSFRVLSAEHTAVMIDLVLQARMRALRDEATEVCGYTPADSELVVAALRNAGRDIPRVKDRDGMSYIVFDFDLQKRSAYYAFEDWAATDEGKYYLWRKWHGRWCQIPVVSECGRRFVIPRLAKGVFKTRNDHVYGGQAWFDVLNQIGGCPAEFVDAWNDVTDQRLEACGLPKLDSVGSGPRPRDMPEPIHERPRFRKLQARSMLHKAARLSKSTVPLTESVRKSIVDLLDAARNMRQQASDQQADLGRAARRPATHHTRPASGAEPGEPVHRFPRALRKTLLELGVPVETADKMIDTGASTPGGTQSGASTPGGNGDFIVKGNDLKGKRK